MLNFVTEKLFKGNKNLSFIIISVLMTIILILIIALMVNSCSTKISSYSDLENELISAAKKYSENNVDKMPSEVGKSVVVTDNELVDNKYIEKLNKLYSKDTCSATVKVIKTDGTYLYVPMLKCQKYETKILKDEIISTVVKSGDGLYLSGKEYIFRGEYVNNYVKIENKIWRILSIDSNGIRIFLNEKKLQKVVWDDRYNLDKKSSYGKNTFEISRIKDSLETIYYSEDILSKSEKTYIVNADWCIGGISEHKQTSSVNLCDKKVNGYIGLFYATDYAKASLEPTCKNYDDTQCRNYNYIATLPNNNWTLNNYTGNSYQVFGVSSSGPNIAKASAKLTLRPVVYLNPDLRYVSGDGSESNPYVIK